MKRYQVKPPTQEDVVHVVGYFRDLTSADCERMGILQDRLPPPARMAAGLSNRIENPPANPTEMMLVWHLDGEPIGMNTIKDVVPGEVGFMHLHMWAQNLRGKGHGARLFCLAALQFYQIFDLKKIYCEPKADNEAPNRMLRRIGFEWLKAHEAASSDISAVALLNRFLIDPATCKDYLSSLGD